VKFDVVMIITNKSDNDDDANVTVYNEMTITTDISLGGSFIRGRH